MMNKILLAALLSSPACLWADAGSQLEKVAAASQNGAASDLETLKQSSSKIDGARDSGASRAQPVAGKYSLQLPPASSQFERRGPALRFDLPTLSATDKDGLPQKKVPAPASKDDASRHEWMIPAANALGVAAAAGLTAALGGVGLLLGLAVWAGLAYLAAKKTGLTPKVTFDD